MMKHLLFCFLLLSQWAVGQKKDGAKPPNILFCIADDWSAAHAGVYGDRAIATPNVDRIAREGAVFMNAFCAAPSCTPSRAAILTGQYPHQLEEGGNLWGSLPARYPNYTRLLADQGYLVGHTRKGWGPGKAEVGGYPHNPAGPAFADFATFYAQKAPGQPFCFWFGSTDPHRPYQKGSGIQAGLRPETVQVPPCWPDVPEVRSDMLDYYHEVQRFDREVGELYDFLAQKGELDNTIIVVTSDNGMPFPRAKANVYDLGTRMPLVIAWRAQLKDNQVINELVNLLDLAPTFLAAAGLKVPAQVAGTNLLPLLTGQRREDLKKVQFLSRERHAYVRTGNQGYPARAVRTPEFLYVRNLRPERFPAGDPEMVFSVGPYGDCDDSPTKAFILQNQDNEACKPYFSLCFAKRPAEELYDLRQDPHQLHNLADAPAYAAQLAQLRRLLKRWQRKTGDPYGQNPADDRWDKFPYYGEKTPK
jgi:N-sulfoglucosamine sulfohydrolase